MALIRAQIRQGFDDVHGKIMANEKKSVHFLATW